jgi:catechol 2,3-dioxygenase-like lactoylglutathione lyase family enzyme
MRSASLFAAGVCVGALLTQGGLAQEVERHGLNHVGLVVEDHDAALDFYTRTMGLREAYTVRRPDGRPLLTYLQLNRETFVELIPAAPGQPAGITHFGVEVDDIDDAVARMRRAGATVADPGVTPARARFTRMVDPDGVQIEVLELGPESLQRQAMDAWP